MTESDTFAGASVGDAAQWRRRELGRFLRSRRARVAPADHGLAATTRHRRTSGLRREEVALLLDVSVSWYTKLEQGVAVSASPRLLGRMADVLLLSPVERDQLMRLGIDEPGGGAMADADQVLPSVQMIIDAMHYAPAFVLTPRTDYIASNRAARAFFGDFETFAGEGNQLVSLFLDDAVRRVLPNWQESARIQVAMFRAAYARNMQHARVRELVAQLLEKSPEFHALWQEYDLPTGTSRDLQYHLPNGTQGHFRHFTFFADLDGQFRVEVFNPIGEDTLKWMVNCVNSYGMTE